MQTKLREHLQITDISRNSYPSHDLPAVWE